jgi:hypothetical protein
MAWAVGQAEADILAEFTAGTDTMTFVTGQSATTTTGGPFDHITFNFYSDVAGTMPTARGDLFILTQEYLGTSSGLSSSTPGFLAESTGISGGVYQFDSSVTLMGGTQYFFYADQGVLHSVGEGVSYSGGSQ